MNDQNVGGPRPSSGAFKDAEMSVDAEPILNKSGLDWSFSLRDNPNHFLVRFRAGDAREKALSVIHKPQPDNAAHTEVHGKKTTSIARQLAAASQWVKAPPNPAPSP